MPAAVDTARHDVHVARPAAIAAIAVAAALLAAALAVVVAAVTLALTVAATLLLALAAAGLVATLRSAARSALAAALPVGWMLAFGRGALLLRLAFPGMAVLRMPLPVLRTLVLALRRAGGPLPVARSCLGVRAVGRFAGERGCLVFAGIAVATAATTAAAAPPTLAGLSGAASIATWICGAGLLAFTVRLVAGRGWSVGRVVVVGRCVSGDEGAGGERLVGVRLLG